MRLLIITFLKDFDGGRIGQAVTQAVLQNQGAGKITWEVKPASAFPGGQLSILEAIRNEDVWAILTGGWIRCT